MQANLRSPKLPFLTAAILSALLLSSSSLSAQDPLQIPPPPDDKSDAEPAGARFSTAVDLVVITATVTDRLHQLVTGLPREAFEIFQDGKRQPIAQFSNRDIPVSMGIVVDSSASMTNKRVAVNAAALALARASNPEDEIFILNFKNTPEITQDFTNDIELLSNALSQVQMWGGTAVLDAVQKGEQHLQSGTKDKKILLIITDGEDELSKTTLKNLLPLLQKSDVMIYAIGILGRPGTRGRRNAEKMLKALADVSGGAAFFPETAEEVGPLATRIARDIRNQYVLGYALPAGATPGFHKMKVTAEARWRGKLTVRSRPGFYYEGSQTSR